MLKFVKIAVVTSIVLGAVFFLPADTPKIDKRSPVQQTTRSDLPTLASSESSAKPVPNVVMGRVTDQAGTPLGQVRWRISAVEKWQEGQWKLPPLTYLPRSDQPEFVMDSEGRFELKFPEKARYDLQFDKDGYAPVFLYQVGSDGGELHVVMKEGVPVRGSIVGMDGTPLTGKTPLVVRLRYPSRDVWFQTSTHVDAQGRFEFPHVSPPTKAPFWKETAQWQIVCLGKVVPIDVVEGKPVDVRLEVDLAEIANLDQKTAQRAWCSRPKTADGESHVWRVRSCKNCYSVQGIEALQPASFSSFDHGRIVGKEWKWQYQGKDYLTCQHEWKDSVSRAVPMEIASGQVVLVHKGDVYGAFLLTAQSVRPETAEFVWRYGTDNTGSFNTGDPDVKWSSNPKSVQNRKGELMIEFGPFEIQWSRGAGGKGWIYYGKFPGDELAENDLAICVTDEQSFDRIRPQDTKWQYRRSPVDGL